MGIASLQLERSATIGNMPHSAAILKAADLLRAAGDDAAADELIAELDEQEPEIVIVETEPEVVEIEIPEPEPITEQIAEAGNAEVQIIEAQTDSAIELMEAEARIEQERADAQAARDAELLAAIVEAEPDPEPDPDPRSQHWFYRPLGKRK